MWCMQAIEANKFIYFEVNCTQVECWNCCCSHSNAIVQIDRNQQMPANWDLNMTLSGTLHSDFAMCRKANKFRILHIFEQLQIIFRLIFFVVFVDVSSFSQFAAVFIIFFISFTRFARFSHKKAFFCKEFNNYSCDNISKRLLSFFFFFVMQSSMKHACIIRQKR